MGQAVPGQGGERLHQLVPERGQPGRVRPGLGQPRGGRPVRRADELEQQLGVQDLRRIGDRDPGRVQPGQRAELSVRPLAGDSLAAERTPARHRPVDPGLPDPAPFQVAAVPVEHPVPGVAVALGREQAGPAAGHAAPDQEDVGFLAGLQDAELGVDGGQVGDQPPGMRLRAALRRDGLVPGRPAVALGQAVGRVELLDRRQRPAADALDGGGFVVVETPLTAAGPEFSTA